MKTGTQLFGIVIGTRGFFNAELARAERAKMLSLMREMGHRVVLLDEHQTPAGSGAIETRLDASRCARLLEEHRREVSGIIVMLPNFGDEVAVVSALHEADCRVPVLVQASPDDLDKLDYQHRRDAFCGKISVCNNLTQHGIPFSLTSTHVTAIDGPRFRADLERFAAVCRVVRGVRTARIGAVGARPAAFQTMRYSEKLLQASGVTVVPVDLSEIIAAARALKSSDGLVRAKTREIRDYGSLSPEVDAELVDLQASFCVALDRWVQQNEIDALGVLCWQSIQLNYGCATCLAMSMLSDRLVPAACEVDVTGALSMHALALATGRAPALADWNNNYGNEPDMCVAQHCSAYARSFVANPVRVSHLEIMSHSIGPEVCYGAVIGKVAAGPMTFCRIATDDVRGSVKVYCGDGQFTDDPFEMNGGIAVCRIPAMQELLAHVCENGYEHHVALVRDHCSAVLAEALGKYLKWPVHVHGRA